MHAIEFVTSQPWVITDAALENIVAIAQRVHDVDGLDLETLAAKRGRYLEGSRRVQVRDGTAIIPVIGPIFRYANMFTEISGATSTQVLATDFRVALEDPQVQSILLDVNSPGGTASGINELADMIFDARGEKPIIAYAGGEIASGAYWLGSAADEIVIDRIGLAGSIGAKVTWTDTSARDARAGVRTVEIVSSVSPDKVIDVNQDEGRAKVQQIVDDLAGVFVEAVARNRGVSVETVLSDFGRGGMMIGKSAVEAGLADRLGSLEAVLSELQAAHQPAHAIDNRRVFFMSKTTKQTGAAAAKGPIAVSNTEELHAAIAAGHTVEEITIESANVEEIQAAARAEGVAEATAANEQAIIAARNEATTAERARVTGLQGIAVKGYEDVVTKAIASGATVEATAVQIAQAQRSRGSVTTLQNDAPRAVEHGGQQHEAGGSKPWSKITAKQNARIQRQQPAASARRR